MPQETGFNFAALDDPPAGQTSGGFNFSALGDPAPAPAGDERSLIGRALDVALTPLVSPEAAARVTGSSAPLPERGILGTALAAVQAIPDVVRNFAEENRGQTLGGMIGKLVMGDSPTLSGFGRGGAEGALANLSDPVSLAGFLTMGTSQVIARPLLQGIRNLAGAERALVAARLRSAPLDEINRLRAELQSLRSSVDAQRAMLRFARGADLAGSGTVAARGVEQAATAESLPELGAGLLQVGLGGLSAMSATRVPDVPPPGPLHAAELPAARGYAVTPSGQAAPAGASVPAEVVPDPSGVRAVRGAWARREPRAALPPGPSYVAGDGGVVGRLEQAPQVAKQAGRGATAAAAESKLTTVPARIIDREFDGATVTRKVYSSDPTVTADAPKVQLTPRERVELQRIAKELEALPFTRHTFNFDVPGQGGTPEIVPGAAGSPVYQDIKALGASGSRGDVLDGINRFLAGEHNAAGQRALEVARGRLRGDPHLSRPMLPEDAGVRDEPLTGDFSDEDFQAFSKFVDDMATLEPVTPGVREPGEEGFINPGVLNRMASGSAGAAVGYASGDEDESLQDRLQRAIVYGAAGAVAPSLIAKRGPAGTMLRGTSRGSPAASNAPGAAGRDALPTSGRPAPKPDTPLRDPRANVEPFIQKFPPEIRDGLRQVLADAGGYQAQRRGAVDQEQVGKLAEQVRVDLQRRAKVGTAANAEQIAQHVNAVATTQAKVREIADRINRGQNTDADILALEQARAELNTVLATTMGLRAEAGRALAQFRTLARVLDSGSLQVIGEAAERLRGDAARFAADFGKLPDDPIARYRWLQQQVTPSTMDRLRQYYYSSILSGPVSHERNFLGNAANVFTNLAVTPAAAAADVVRSTVTGAPRTVFFGELPFQVVGAVLGVERGLSDALFSLKHGVNRSALTQSMGAAEAGKLDFVRSEFAGGLANPFNLPTRMLDAADQLFRGISKNQEAYGAAYAQAKREGKRGQALVERMTELRTGNSPEAQAVQQIADQYARRSVFQEQGGPIVGLTQAAVKAFPPLMFPIAFIKTPANIFRQGFEFSPAGFGMKAVRATEGRQQSQSLGRAAVGTALLAPLAWLAATGRISGSGPSNPSERAQLMESGWRPNSVRVGDQWVSYALFQPVSVQAGIIANAFEAWKAAGAKSEDLGPVVGAAVLKAMRSGLDQSFLSGLSDLFEAINGFNLESASRYAGRIAHSLTPFAGAQRTAQRALDPVVRDPEGLGETVLASVPGQSDQLPARHTRFGQEIVREGGPAKRALDPFNVSTVKDDPVLRMLDALQIRVGFPRATTVRGYEPTPEEKRALEIAKGREWYAALERLQQRPGFARATPEKQRRFVDDARENASRVVTARAVALLRRQQAITVEALTSEGVK